MKFHLLPLLVIFGLILSACNMPVTLVPTVSQDDLATRVSLALTQMPTVTPHTSSVSNPEEPTATPEAPSSADLPTVTSSPEPSLTALPTETPSLAPSPTPEPSTTPTMLASDPRLQLGLPTWHDNFTDDTNWPTGEDTFTAAEIEDGIMKFKGLSNLDGWRITWKEFTNAYLEMTFKTTECTGLDHYGLVFRVPDKTKADKGYLFSVSCNGRFSFRNWDGKEMNSLIDWTSNDAIKAGANQTNRIGVMAKGDRLAFYANGVLLGEFKDATYQKGVFGVLIGARETTHLEILIEDIGYWELD